VSAPKKQQALKARARSIPNITTVLEICSFSIITEPFSASWYSIMFFAILFAVDKPRGRDLCDPGCFLPIDNALRDTRSGRKKRGHIRGLLVFTSLLQAQAISGRGCWRSSPPIAGPSCSAKFVRLTSRHKGRGTDHAIGATVFFRHKRLERVATQRAGAVFKY
jgi:hypothetical protein